MVSYHYTQCDKNEDKISKLLNSWEIISTWRQLKNLTITSKLGLPFFSGTYYSKSRILQYDHHHFLSYEANALKSIKLTDDYPLFL